MDTGGFNTLLEFDEYMSEDELLLADAIAEELRYTGYEDRSYTIWNTCDEAGVDHHKMARYLSYRSSLRRKKIARNKKKEAKAK